MNIFVISNPLQMSSLALMNTSVPLDTVPLPQKNSSVKGHTNYWTF